MAAQTARDRKKQRMGELEDALADLEAENQRLLSENVLLQAQSGELRQENMELREQLHSADSLVKTECVEQGREHGSPESAVLKDPLPQEAIRALLHLTTRCIAFILTLRCIQLLHTFSRISFIMQSDLFAFSLVLVMYMA